MRSARQGQSVDADKSPECVRKHTPLDEAGGRPVSDINVSFLLFFASVACVLLQSSDRLCDMRCRVYGVRESQIDIGKPLCHPTAFLHLSRVICNTLRTQGDAMTRHKLAHDLLEVRLDTNE